MMDLSLLSPDLVSVAGDQISSLAATAGDSVQYLAQQAPGTGAAQGTQLDGGSVYVTRIGDRTVQFFRGISWVGLIAAAFIILFTYFIPKKNGHQRGFGGITSGAIIGSLLSFYFLYDVNRLFTLLESLSAVIIDIGNWVTGIVDTAANGGSTSTQG